MTGCATSVLGKKRIIMLMTPRRLIKISFTHKLRVNYNIEDGRNLY